MRIAVNLGGDVYGSPASPTDIVEEARTAEQDGFGIGWTTHFSRALDALTCLAAAGIATSQIELGVGVVPTYPRHPLALAQQAATAQVFCGGRLTLGVGVSHRPVIEGMHGLTYASPAKHMREYLSILVPALHGQEVHFHGELLSADGGFAVPGTSPVPVVVGALSPRMVRVAGELADGVVTWLAGPRTLAETITPTLREAATGAGRGDPQVVVGIPVAVTDDADLAKASAETRFGRYNGLKNYQQVFAREGVATVGELVLVGDEDEVTRRITGYADAGGTQLWPVPFPVDGDPDSLLRTRSLLAKLAR